MKSKRFEPIRDIADNSAKDLSQAMAEAERRVVELERQLQQLQNYREDYLLKAAQVSGPMDTVRLQNNRAFLDRLADAIRAQLQKVGVARAEYEVRRSQWSDKRIEAEALGRAVDRFRHEERNVADRHEQGEADDTGLRLWRAARGPRDGL
jgi:flagellar export protein FliJ